MKCLSTVYAGINRNIMTVWFLKREFPNKKLVFTERMDNTGSTEETYYVVQDNSWCEYRRQDHFLSGTVMKLTFSRSIIVSLENFICSTLILNKSWYLIKKNFCVYAFKSGERE